MHEILIALLILAGGYLINIFYISVLYHRGLTHRALILKPFMLKWIAWTGNWLTGIDPKGWVCMHRLHHLHSDTDRDPHSPVHYGVFGVIVAQLTSYKRILKRLMAGDRKLNALVSDLPFDVSPLNRKGLWPLPYVLHLLLAFFIGIGTEQWLYGAAYFVGIMSHPIQGWMVNSLGHYSGYRNFECPDDSRNNLLVAMLVFGEGYQNNHHMYPQRANFGVKRWEFDPGYVLCRLTMAAGLCELTPVPVEAAGTAGSDLVVS